MRNQESRAGTPTSGKRIIIFAKQPDEGYVKTRLIPAIGAKQAAELHTLMTRQIVAVACASQTAAVELWCCPSSQHELFQSLQKEFPLSLHTQQGQDLGERMHNAFLTVLGKQHGSVAENNAAIIVGSDCPTITPAHFKQAFAVLQHECSATLIPALDGGYVLFGLRCVSEQLFNHIPWGTDEVLSTTKSRLQRLNWKWEEFSALSDIDTYEDLLNLKRSAQQYQLDEKLLRFLQRQLT